MANANAQVLEKIMKTQMAAANSLIQFWTQIAIEIVHILQVKKDWTKRAGKASKIGCMFPTTKMRRDVVGLSDRSREFPQNVTN